MLSKLLDQILELLMSIRFLYFTIITRDGALLYSDE